MISWHISAICHEYVSAFISYHDMSLFSGATDQLKSSGLNVFILPPD